MTSNSGCRSSVTSVGGQSAVYFDCQYDGCPCLFTLGEAVKLCEKSLMIRIQR